MSDSLTVLGRVSDYALVQKPTGDTCVVVEMLERLVVEGIYTAPVATGNHFLTEAGDRFLTEGGDLFITET